MVQDDIRWKLGLYRLYLQGDQLKWLCDYIPNAWIDVEFYECDISVEFWGRGILAVCRVKCRSL